MPDHEIPSALSVVERRLARLEAINELNELKWRYSAYCDDRYNPEGISSLFTDDGVWEATLFGRHEGREAIKEFFASIGSTIQWAFHGLTNPSVLVADDGRSAVGRWYSIVLASMSRDEGQDGLDSVVMTAHYDDRFVLQEGEWRLKSLKCTIHQSSNLDRGWAEQPFR
jgi:SnoaL-like domain